MVFRLVLLNTGPDRIDILRLDQQRHATAELSLDGPGRGRDAILQVVLIQQIMEGQTVLIGAEEDIPTEMSLSH